MGPLIYAKMSWITVICIKSMETVSTCIWSLRIRRNSSKVWRSAVNQCFSFVLDLFSFDSRVFFFLNASNKQQRAARHHLSLLSAPCQKRQMMWILPFKNAAAHFGSFRWSNSTVQYLGSGFDSMEEEPLSHCLVKLHRVVWISVMCTFNEAH